MSHAPLFCHHAPSNVAVHETESKLSLLSSFSYLVDSLVNNFKAAQSTAGSKSLHINVLNSQTILPFGPTDVVRPSLQLDSVESLQVLVFGRNRDLLSGTVRTLVVTAKNVVYKVRFQCSRWL